MHAQNIWCALDASSYMLTTKINNNQDKKVQFFNHTAFRGKRLSVHK